MALGVMDLAATFGFPGNDATPSPSFDNVSFWRYDSGGPAFATRNIDRLTSRFFLFQNVGLKTNRHPSTPVWSEASNTMRSRKPESDTSRIRNLLKISWVPRDCRV